MDPNLRAALEAGSRALQAGTSPERVAQLVLAAMNPGQLHIFTDVEMRDLVVARSEQILAAVDGWSLSD